MTGAFITVIVACAAFVYFCCGIKKIEADIEALRHEYLDIMNRKAEQVNDCLDHWKETIDSLDRSIETTNNLLEVLRDERHD